MTPPRTEASLSHPMLRFWHRDDPSADRRDCPPSFHISLRAHPSTIRRRPVASDQTALGRLRARADTPQPWVMPTSDRTDSREITRAEFMAALPSAAAGSRGATWTLSTHPSDLIFGAT